MSPLGSDKRQAASIAGSPLTQHKVKKQRGEIRTLQLIKDEAKEAIANGSSSHHINRGQISRIQKDKANIHTQVFRGKWLSGQSDDEFKDQHATAVRDGLEIGTKNALEAFIRKRYSYDLEKADKKTQSFFKACKDVKANVTVERPDGKKYSMNLVDIIRPVMDLALKDLLREKIRDATYETVKDAYSINVEPDHQDAFDADFDELMDTNGGNDEITAQIMHEFAMQTQQKNGEPHKLSKLPKNSGDKTNGNDPFVTGTNGSNGASK